MNILTKGAIAIYKLTKNIIHSLQSMTQRSDKELIQKNLVYEKAKIPDDMQPQINKICKKYSYSPNILESIYYLIRDCCYCMLVIFITLMLRDYVNSIVLFFGYSIVMGTVTTGLWVLGHECGHGAFGRNTLENDFFGFILHSFLLVPYFSWKYSHNKHHKYTNHLILGETHVPLIKNEARLLKKVYNIIGEDAFSIFNIIIHVFFGWPAYLINNETGGRVRYDLKTRIDKNKFKDHFHSNSQVIPKSLGWKVEISTIGCSGTLYGLYYFLGWDSFFWYFGPYIITNVWLVLYTWLQHTHPDVPHYGEDTFTFLRGALSTIDRPYPALIDHLHHHIGTTHVAHHIKYSVPHYRAQAFTKELKIVLKNYYNYDSTSIITALVYTSKTCHYVDGLKGVQKYKCFD